MNPVLAEVVRSGFTESVHRGSVVVLAADGTPRLELGNTREPVFPRSASKPLQALGMLRAGLSVPDDDLALVSASHSGEPEHRRRVLDLLRTHGFTEDDLRCPADLPLHEASREAVLRDGGGRGRATMNCSGKHAGMLATCAKAGWNPASYPDPEHPLQRAIAATVEELAGESIAATGVDGCGAPLFGYSLTGLARAFTRLSGSAVADAMRAHPWLVGGTGREDTVLMSEVPGLLAKGGAEGVHAMALPDGTACALKIDDGASRAREPVLIGLLHALGVPLGGTAEALAERPVLGGGGPVGAIRLSPTAREHFRSS
ncbi:MAG: asparaginase [Pseudonocardiaceae bacterium]|nr:asparaginase [Pseudonocardiaceae bacterium]